MLLQSVDQARGRTIDEIGRASMSSAGFKPLDGHRTDVNGLEAYVGLYQGSISGVGPVTMRAAHIAVGRQVYLLGGFAPRDAFARVDREVDVGDSVVSRPDRTRSRRHPREPARFLYRAYR